MFLLRGVLLKLFFLTGATALGFQLVWARMLANSLGHEMRAVLAVVSTFMGGMAIGAWWLGERIRRSPYPGRWYAGLEAFVGIWAVLVVPKNPLLLLPATIAMGASFPAMERFIRPVAIREEHIRATARQARYIGALYGVNTLGAVAGIILTVWYLLPALGLRASSITLGAVNIVVAAIASMLSRRTSPAEDGRAPASRRLMVTLTITGFLAIGFEILGVRVLSQVMENTIYSFASALAIYLLGTSIGAALYHRSGREQWLDHLLGLAAIACLGGIFILARAQAIYSSFRAAFGDSTQGVAAAEMLLAACIFLPATVLMGAIFSLLIQRQTTELPRLLAVNTLGSALAPFAFGVFLLPVIGSKWALVLVGLTYLTLLSRRRLLLPIIAVTLAAFSPSLRLVQLPSGGTLADYREGVLASLAVVRDEDGNRTLKVNNRFQMGGTSAASTEYREAHLPLLLHDNPRRALFLGTGTGITFGAATLYPGLQADGVELLPEVVEVMGYFKPENFMDEYDDRLRIHVADARRFVTTTTNRYDVIIADLFHPARDGAGTLYTKEHFTAIRARLNEGGICCQWLPLHQMDDQTLRAVTRTFLEVFPSTRAYLLHWSIDVPVLGLFGTDQWPQYTNGWVEARGSSLQNHLKRLGIADSARVFGNFVAGADALRRFAGYAPINTDEHQVVTYAAPRFSYQRNATPYGRLLTVLEVEAPPSDFIRARNVYLKGLVEESEGRITQAIEYYIESARISDEFTAGYARCISLASLKAKDHPQGARVLLERLIEAQPREKLARDLLERLFPATQK